MALISKEKYESVIARLRQLKEEEVPYVIQQINEARQQGDLSENAEYDAAKKKQRDVNAEIRKLEKVLANAEIIDESMLNKNEVGMLAKIHLRSLDTGREFVYQIVSEEEASILEKKISITSDFGRALKGKKKGEKIQVVTNNKTLSFEILDIS